MEMEDLLKAYSNQLRYFIASRMKSKVDVDDVHQEVLMKTLKYFKKIKEPKKFRAWLYQTARTTLIDYYKKSDRYSLEESIEIEKEWEETNDSQKRLSECMKPFIKKLPTKYRMPLEKVELKGVSQKELAIQMGMSYSGLKSRIQRGRHLLYQLYRECCEYDLDVRGSVIHFQSKGKRCASC